MFKRKLLVSALTGALVFAYGFASATDLEQAQQQTRAKKQVYGSQLMTKQERMEHRSKMRAAKTAEEREQIRKEHHERMKERAKERGVALPEEPPVRGGGMGTGCGAEPGCGMGAGRNR